jgi:hypothetical protein
METINECADLATIHVKLNDTVIPRAREIRDEMVIAVSWCWDFQIGPGSVVGRLRK